ncbi:hypothetical protein NHX12_029520 [Muraenolepis orangiensis]|uniref:Uncharacterized protein n=1 Tax=Muraenolepis orangiensis TaxID=630683 RepID=A0A9Q0I297_9TELE|nr:hypothetical protein NHX12_029520 [Muraenolepis orangiensis]
MDVPGPRVGELGAVFIVGMTTGPTVANSAGGPNVARLNIQDKVVVVTPLSLSRNVHISEWLSSFMVLLHGSSKGEAVPNEREDMEVILLLIEQMC